MNKKDKEYKLIVALAYFHRYGWMAFLLLGMLIFRHIYAVAVGVILYSIWTIVGYLCKWKHIYCSFQDAYHTTMTPDSIDWDWIAKSDVYAFLLFFVLGTLMILCEVFEW